MSDFRLTANVLDSETPEEVSWPSDMPWATLQYTKSQIDAAGAVLVDPDADDDDFDDALIVINNWRSSHSFPLNTLQMGLRRLAKQVDPKSLIAQRIKRLRSIGLKLVRFKT